MRTMTRRVAALAIVSTLSLAGCGGSDSDGGADPEPSSSASEAPSDGDSADDQSVADGDTITGTGYSFSVPDGWEVPSGDIPGTEATDVFAANLQDTDGFADNVNVIRLDPAPIDDLDDLEKGLSDELEGAGSTDVTVRDRRDVDGDEAVHIASGQNQQGATYLTEQYNAIHDGASYVITFSFSDTVPQDERDQVADSVLETWAWAS